MQNLEVIEDGAVAVIDDHIEFVGTTEELLSFYTINQDVLVIDATGKLVTPGLIDPHTHIIFDGSRENELEMKLKGMTYLEILNAGGGILKTVKATRKATLEKLVENGKTGLLVPTRDPQALANAILACIKQPEWAREMGQHAQEMIQKRFSLERMVHDYETLYEESIKAKTRR